MIEPLRDWTTAPDWEVDWSRLSGGPGHDAGHEVRELAVVVASTGGDVDAATATNANVVTTRAVRRDSIVA
jgi:hypothetical protein